MKKCFHFFTACVAFKVNFLTMTSTLMYYGAPLTFTEKSLQEWQGGSQQTW